MSNPNFDEMLDLAFQLKKQYENLNEIIDHKLESGDCSIEQISEQINGIRATEDALRPMREDLRDRKAKSPDDLQAVTNDTIELMESIMPKLGVLEKETLESAKRLYPEVEQSVRVVQMQQAYGARA